MSGPRTLRDLQRWAEDAPLGTLIPADSLASMLSGIGDGDDRLSDFTLAEAAEKLGKAPSTIRAWLIAGELKGYKVHGREWRITRAAIAAFLEGQRNGDAPYGARSHGRPADLGAWRARL